MKIARLMVALTALCGLAASTFADVQNIRLSGDIRIRGYYLHDAGGDIFGDQVEGDAAFISQRTRVCVEADLEDHVLVVVTLKAEGNWGQFNDADNSSGAGTGPGGGGPGFAGSDAVNRRWEVGVTEAYLQLNELFYSPATLKLGRQYLNYGRGLIISSVEQEYNYDAARLVLDYYPFTLDIVGASLVNNQNFSANETAAGSADLLFVNARYEMTDSLIKDIEAYFGWVARGSTTPAGAGYSTVPPSVSGSSPVIIGLRGDLNLTEGVTSWFEGAYETGGNGTLADGNISAWLLNAGAKFGKKDVTMSPTVNVNYTYASGGGKEGRHSFLPWFDYVDGYNGYLFAPALNNLHIFNAGASIRPCENTTLAVQGYYYLKVDADSPVFSNSNADFGGPGFADNTGASNREVGWEIDGILGYDYSKDVRVQLVYGAFIPAGAFTDNSAYGAKVAQEVRGEVNVKF